jgi:hypothetical protein
LISIFSPRRQTSNPFNPLIAKQEKRSHEAKQRKSTWKATTITVEGVLSLQISPLHTVPR